MLIYITTAEVKLKNGKTETITTECEETYDWDNPDWYYFYDIIPKKDDIYIKDINGKRWFIKYDDIESITISSTSYVKRRDNY